MRESSSDSLGATVLSPSWDGDVGGRGGGRWVLRAEPLWEIVEGRLKGPTFSLESFGESSALSIRYSDSVGRSKDAGSALWSTAKSCAGTPLDLLLVRVGRRNPDRGFHLDQNTVFCWTTVTLKSNDWINYNPLQQNYWRPALKLNGADIVLHCPFSRDLVFCVIVGVSDWIAEDRWTLLDLDSLGRPIPLLFSESSRPQMSNYLFFLRCQSGLNQEAAKMRSPAQFNWKQIAFDTQNQQRNKKWWGL